MVYGPLDPRDNDERVAVDRPLPHGARATDTVRDRRSLGMAARDRTILLGFVAAVRLDNFYRTERKRSEVCRRVGLPRWQGTSALGPSLAVTVMPKSASRRRPPAPPAHAVVWHRHDRRDAGGWSAGSGRSVEPDRSTASSQCSRCGRKPAG